MKCDSSVVFDLHMVICTEAGALSSHMHANDFQGTLFTIF